MHAVEIDRSLEADLRIDDNVELHWGDGATVLKVVDLIARREGPLGRLLADGALTAARRLGKKTDPAEVATMESRLSGLWAQIRAARVAEPPERGAQHRRTRSKWE